MNSFKSIHFPSQRILLLTGAPGIGKTTVVRQVAAYLRSQGLGGFYTEEIRERGKRQGFRLVTFDGDEKIIAHFDFPKNYQVGKYGLDVEALNEVVEKALALSQAREIYLIDEIGKMECLSERFNRAMNRLLESSKTIVASVALKGTGVIYEIKQRSDSLMWEVTRQNRDQLPRKVLAWVDRQAG